MLRVLGSAIVMTVLSLVRTKRGVHDFSFVISVMVCSVADTHRHPLDTDHTSLGGTVDSLYSFGTRRADLLDIFHVRVDKQSYIHSPSKDCVADISCYDGDCSSPTPNTGAKQCILPIANLRIAFVILGKLQRCPPGFGLDHPEFGSSSRRSRVRLAAMVEEN